MGRSRKDPVSSRKADPSKQAVPQSVLEERQFRALIQGVTDYAIYLLDPDGIIISWNAGAQQILGYEARELIGEPFSRLFTSEERRTGVPRQALQSARQGDRYEREGWRARKDGSHLWANTVIDAIWNRDETLIGYACITRDATEKRAAEQALRESERQFRLLVASVTDYAIFRLDPNGIVSSWNAGAERIKGYKADEIIGHHFSRFFTDVDRAKGTPLRVLYAATQEGRFEAEGWRVRKDGSLFWANAIIDAIRDENGNLIGFAKITRDITERREAQLALQRSQEQLAQSQRMEALGLLTGGIAHDFNNLLMIVGGQAELLKRRATDPKDLRALEAIEMATANGEKLTRQLLAFSRRQQLNPKPLDLGERLSACRELLVSSVGNKAELEYEIADDLWPVEVDPNELELALVNLVVNARDAMPGGGKITVGAQNVRLLGDGEPPLRGKFVAISVGDTGKGIDPKVLPRIFEPFFTTKEVSKGTGLGLSQVHGFTHQSGGGVSAQSVLDTGTTVTMYLPRSHKGVGEAKAEAERHIPAVGTGTVLVVEDNPEVAKVSSMLFDQIGYKVIVVTNAEAALQELAGNTAVDLVFSDVVMPGEMNGTELATLIRKRHPHVPILLTSGYSNAAEAAEKQFPLLRKPYQISALADAVEAVRVASQRVARS
jgi:PAS domain S-box-containing protein